MVKPKISFYTIVDGSSFVWVGVDKPFMFPHSEGV